MLSPHARRGLALLQGGKAEEGLRAFQEGLAANPRDVDCLLGAARVRLLQGEGHEKEARGFLERIAAIVPQHQEARSHLALLRFRAGEKAALGVIRQAASGPGAGVFELLNLGRALADAGEHAASEAAFQKALRLQPGNTFVRMEAGEAALRREDAPAAIAHFQAAARAVPGEYVPMAYLARAHAVAGQLDRALECLEHAIALAPEVPALHEELYLLRSRRGQWAEALKATAVLLQADPARIQYRYWKGVALVNLGRLPEAAAALEAVVKDAPDSADARQALADVYFRQDDLARAEPLLLQTLARDPGNAAAAIDLANVYFRQDGGMPKAEAVLKRALAAHPDDPLVHYNLALSLANRDAAAALPHARMAAASGSSIANQAKKLVEALSSDS